MKNYCFPRQKKLVERMALFYTFAHLNASLTRRQLWYQTGFSGKTGPRGDNTCVFTTVSVAWLCAALCSPTDCSPPTPLSMGFFRQEYCSGQPFSSPGGLPNSGINPRPPALQSDSLPSEPPGKPTYILCVCVCLIRNLLQEQGPLLWPRSGLLSEYLDINYPRRHTCRQSKRFCWGKSPRW